MAIRVVIADGQEIVRAGVRLLLDAADDLDVVATVADGASAIEATHRLAPDVCLVAAQLADLDGLEVTRRLTSGSGVTGCPVVLITPDDPDDADEAGDTAYAALAAGAIGLVSRSSGPELLVEAVRAASRGESLIAPPIATRLLRRFRLVGRPLVDDTTIELGRRDTAGSVGSVVGPPLTQREDDVLVAVAAGLTNAEIAERLHVSVSTVKVHLAGLMRKLGARNRVELARWAFRTGRAG